MACTHASCECRFVGCGTDHPPEWQPKVTANINGVVVVGEDQADCMAHYMLQAGYPTNQPEHLRRVAQLVVARNPLQSASGLTPRTGNCCALPVGHHGEHVPPLG